VNPKSLIKSGTNFIASISVLVGVLIPGNSSFYGVGIKGLIFVVEVFDLKLP
jgi:hypothetical protein